MENKAQWYSIKNKAESESLADIYIMDQIGRDYWDDSGISGEQFTKDLMALKVDTINFWVNSPGGSVFDANVIYNAIKRHPAKNKVMHITGMAASAASYLMMSCDKRIIYDGGVIMVHLPSTICYGNREDFLKEIEILGTVENEMVEIYKKATNLSENEIKALLEAETWMGSDEAIEKGFCTEKSEAKATASISSGLVKKNNYKNIPKNLIQKEDINKDSLVSLLKKDGYNEKQIKEYFEKNNTTTNDTDYTKALAALEKIKL